MAFLVFIFVQVLSSQSAVAGDCERALLKIIASATADIDGPRGLPKGSPCWNAAHVGRTNGRPGCFPPGTTQLQKLLQGHMAKGEATCKTVCDKEGKKNSCLSLLSFNQVRELGLEGVARRLKGRLPVDAGGAGVASDAASGN